MRTKKGKYLQLQFASYKEPTLAILLSLPCVTPAVIIGSAIGLYHATWLEVYPYLLQLGNAAFDIVITKCSHTDFNLRQGYQIEKAYYFIIK